MVQKRHTTDFEPLTPAEVETRQMWEICEPAPVETKTQYRDDQVIINLKRDETGPRSYYANNTSVNRLIDLYGENEKSWVGKHIALEVKTLTDKKTGTQSKAIFVSNSSQS